MAAETAPVMTRGAEQTRALGERLGRRLGPGDVVALIGHLGSGKTTLIQGICRGLGVKGVVNSPSFTIINEYRGRVPVYHMDCYRLAGIEDLLGLGCEEYFYGDGVCLVEWAEKALELMPPHRIEVYLEHQRGGSRRITMRTVGEDADSGGGDGHTRRIDRPGQ
jgi:tRNA threonylcarbamoyladenosine biosynthesis protein TsaE